MSAALEHESGLAALAEDSDVRGVLARAGARDDEASLAVDVYTHRLCAGVAAMVASLGGIDALVFTGGVREKVLAIRARTALGVNFLSVEIDAGANDRVSSDAAVTAQGAPSGRWSYGHAKS
jgi:acetate kinase